MISTSNSAQLSYGGLGGEKGDKERSYNHIKIERDAE